MNIIFTNPEEEQLKNQLLLSNKFANWLKQLEENFIVSEVTIHKVFMFGNNVGFVNAQAEVTDKAGNRAPGIAFIRGNSVSILLVIKEKDSGLVYTVLINQSRVPVGKAVLECPAGMVDEGVVNVKAIEELQEEVGRDIPFDQNKLYLLDKGFTSPGGSDEEITIYYYEMEMTRKEIAELQGRETGLEGEFITLKVVPLKQLPVVSESIVSKLAYYMYSNIQLGEIVSDFRKNFNAVQSRRNSN